MSDLAMALLTQDRPRRDEQFLVVRAVRRMTGHAVFAHRSMLKQERTALLGVTIVAGLIDAISLEQWLGGAAVRVMAVDAGELALEQRHVRAPRELGALRLVARDTSFVDG